MFHPDFRFAPPTGGDLLAELGVDRHTIRELAEDERAIRCPDRGAVRSAHGFASLSPEPASDPASALSPAERRWRRA